MQIEIRLKKVLQEYGLDTRSVTQRIARDVKKHRHTIGKLYRNQLLNPSLDTLGLVCDWLIDHGVRREVLPHALFGALPSGLWEATSLPGTVAVVVGEYHQKEARGRTVRWIAQQDALVMAKVVQSLSGAGASDHRQLRIVIEYVPLRLGPGPHRGSIRKEIGEITQALLELRKPPQSRSTILIGSQRVNHSVENLVAATFGCAPFRRTETKGAGVPFRLVYRKDDRATPSCFGSHALPKGCKRDEGPGIYYVDGDGAWRAVPWKAGERDGGVIVVVRDPGSGSLEMAVFGYSGPGTEAMGNQLLHNPDAFWPPCAEVNGKRVGVHICAFEFAGRGDRGGQVRDVRTISLERAVLVGKMKVEKRKKKVETRRGGRGGRTPLSPPL